MEPISLSSCVNGGITEGPTMAPMLIITTGIIGILFSIVLTHTHAHTQIPKTHSLTHTLLLIVWG